MFRIAEQRLSRLIHCGQQDVLEGGRVGLEKESLRVNSEGGIAQTPHPAVLGSALTHPYITTDYSEALLEFITPPFTDMAESLRFLCRLQAFTYERLQDEILWATSMPCVVSGEASIPIAQYGSSNPGLMKTVYRRGLGYRYGRVMQVIAGVHYNYSLSDHFWTVFQTLEGDTRPSQTFVNDGYFGMIRNLQRFGWIIPYLFGASPAVCKSFLTGKSTRMPAFDESTYYEPFATSLRMGDIGYQNRKEDETGVKACYDGLDAYVDSITRAINTPSPVYEKIGVVVNGEYRQLNANLLQIENEYYSTIRPKQILLDNEKPSLALKRRGVRYVELRSLDVNAFDPLGINEVQLRFLEAFLLLCLLHESPPIDAGERDEIDANQLAAAHRGRNPALRLRRHGKEVPLRAWASEICEAMEGVCEALDQRETRRLGKPFHGYAESLVQQKEAVRDPDRTPSAHMLREMRETQEGFFRFAKRMSDQHAQYFRALQLSEQQEQSLTEEAQRSLERQQQLEAEDPVSFEQYLQEYFAQA